MTGEMNKGRNNTKYRQIYLSLKESLERGAYSPGDKLPAETALSAQFGVSRPTVIRALNALRDSGYIVRKAGSGSYVAHNNDEQPNANLGMLVTGLGTGKLTEQVSASIAEQASVMGYSLLWNTTDHQGAAVSSADPVPWETRLRRICEQYGKQGVSGVFFEPLELEPRAAAINAMVLSLLDQAGIAVVLLDADVATFPARSKYDLAGMDNIHIGYTVTRHLLSLGYRRIDFFYQPGSAPTVQMRIKGYQMALLDGGLAADPNCIHIGDPADLPFVRARLDMGVQNIVCANDVTAANLIHTLDELGLRIPEDVRLVGVDDVKYAKLLRVPLTTYRQPSAAIGCSAVELMLSRLQHPEREARTVSFIGELVVRHSCGSR